MFLQVKGLPRNAEFICLLKVRQKLSRAIIFENILKGCVWMEDRYLDKHSRTLNNVVNFDIEQWDGDFVVVQTYFSISKLDKDS